MKVSEQSKKNKDYFKKKRNKPLEKQLFLLKK